MSSKQKRELTRVVLVLALHLYPLQLCHSESAGGRWGQIHGARRADEKTHQSANLRRTSRSGPQGLRSEPAALPGETSPPFILQKVDERGRNVASNNLSWTAGHVSTGPKASTSDHEEGYQADFTGFHGVQGKVLGPSFDSSPHFPEWQAMRPFVQCDENVMTFTASGQGLTHLLVDREEASPISVFQLPPYCGYSVRTSWSDLEMMAPYDACYITQENGSYVLPMLWWDTPLKLSCPVQPSTPAPSPSLPSVFCSPYGMAVQKHGQEQEIPMLGVKVNGGWRPFVSEECAYLIHSRPDELTFFISYKASCVTIGDGLSLQLVYDDQGIHPLLSSQSSASLHHRSLSRDSHSDDHDKASPNHHHHHPHHRHYHPNNYCSDSHRHKYNAVHHNPARYTDASSPVFDGEDDQRKTWLPLSTVSPLCGYMLQMAGSSGVILHSPLPACHSLSRTPTTISLPLMFWDLSMGHYRTLEPQCPYESTPVTTAPVTPPASTTPPSTTPSPVQKPKVSCSSHHMTIKLPSGPISGILLKDVKGNSMSLQDAPEHCGYSASKGKDGRIQLSLRLQSQCHMSVQAKCSLPSDQRLPCGPAFVSQPQCLSKGCCFSKNSEACYYPMDECTIDHHFVFSVPASITEPPLSLAQLVAGSNSTCRPQRVTSEYALFKIPMDSCGARRVVVGQMVFYMVEVVNKVQGISVNHGTITRDSPIRFLVECRFQPGSVLTVSYLVKTPTLGPGVQTQEMHGVQLRIAKDPEYSSFYPQYHQPMQMLLGKPLYLEVRLLNAPDPGLVLLVHFCVAYPRSGTSVWVLLYNGCPNPLDPAPHQAVLSAPQPPSPRGQTRRFTISTFQFLPDGEFKDPNEEIYFMCSTEICSPRDGPCVEGCFGQ
ncbi:unnamed protein product [Pleuronectes platessa]|uniref:Uncharacterized protein n=1 Tax=Pleuronectes platessa TaxID=8262 RepID=A0A9N7UX25_PLEPL|nr:unnamed protein product [Pleuronectes platessa]